MTVKRWQKKAKPWEEILTKFNFQNPKGIKRDLSQLKNAGGGCNSNRKRSMTYVVVKQDKLGEFMYQYRSKKVLY